MLHLGIHLPQFGRAAGPTSITRAARHAEELGYTGLWVSDHVVQPASQSYPSPYLFDPLVTLTWAAAVTTEIGLGTSVLVAPHHAPLEMANTLASLDALSGGRLTVGVGVGWSAGEFEALGQGFHDRGKRLDEIIDLWRTVWRDDPTTFHGRYVSFEELRVLPKPAHDIDIWVGGSGERARRRAVQRGEGFHFIGVTPDELRDPIAELRSARPEPDFVISLRTGWDPQGMDPDRIRAESQDYEAAGVTYVVAAPWRHDLDSWLRSMELLAEIIGLTPR
ncbi:MAG: F420-dependent glucose-6-phosphate dehydrogenase [Acidimicrobiales bacterium]|nr:MAG: LLM class F420-dependent oxidoreductase [Actinomycetota bacterium]MBV6509716.1 F420-dependent glucose-6-phosphate dehydrogenase [Acidimicrobiales bacterium]RIK02656.1 MAG: LLM class F420-dependent oxidoreductase [Acidobacteriota bacterium]